jgi:hypothetical protein
MTNSNIVDFFIISFVIYWIVSVLYVINWHRKQGNLSYGTIFVAILIGGVVILILWDEQKEERRRRKEREIDDRNRRWFQTIGLINRNAIPDYGRTVPPPPPISRNRINPRDARAEWQRQNGYNNIKNFKFFK